MATVLLIVIYISFIGLGIPDSIFGSAWPAIYTDFGLPVSAAGVITLIISLCTALASMISPRLINRFGTATVCAVSTVSTAIALLGFSLSGNILFFILFALPLGFGGGAIDTALNNYVALHYNASQMNYLHCFYGIGVFVSPYIMSEVLERIGSWRSGYRVVFGIQIFISAVMILSLPLWKKVKNKESESEETVTPKTLTYRQMFKMPAVTCAWGIFICSCAIECTTGAWCSTYFVNTKNISLSSAAFITALYYGGLALARLLSGLLSAKLSEMKIILLSLVFLGLGAVLMFVPHILIVSALGIFLIGFGIGPVFPNFIHLMPQCFGKDVSQSVIGSQMTASYVSIMSVPTVFGLLSEKTGLWILPNFVVIVLLMLVFFVLRFARLTVKQCA